MEGEPEESNEDVQEEDKPTVLWERCIQQSIFVDLSEDESLHFSDLESSLAVRLSQAESAASEASIHLSGSAELSALDDTSSESSVVCSQSERLAESKNKSSMLYLSVQKPNTMQDELPLNGDYEDPGQNTSDEDQEDLPYDCDLGSPYFNQTVSSDGNMSADRKETVHASPDFPDLLELTTTDRDDSFECLGAVEHNAKKPAPLLKEDANTKQGNSRHASKANELALLCPSSVDMNHVLLRHFSQEELLQSGRLIEAETLPEVSLLESVDDTVFSLALTHKSTAINSNHSARPACNNKIDQSYCFGMTDEKSNNASMDEAESKTDYVTPAVTDSIESRSASTDSNASSRDNSAVDVVEQEKAEEAGQDSKVPFVRTRLFSEMKYGQGQVHYPLPDFSKVASKVKIPKATSGPPRPVPQSPSIMQRSQSSPGMLEVISRVLEDSILPSEKPYVFKHEDQQTPPVMVHHLQAEYDKLLTKYAEAENLIDQMRLGTNTQTASEIILYSDTEYHQLKDDDHQENLAQRSCLGSVTSNLPPSENFVEEGATAAQNNFKRINNTSPSQPEEGLSDGDRMTVELSEIINQFMQKVKEFKLSVSNMSISTAEQQMMLRSMMEAQDQLERKYISKKEEHRALEMQNYMRLSGNTGTFDPNRLVEGDIFRIGMHLEDIKEMIDKNVCEQISPPHLSSTPTPACEMLHVKPSALCMSTPSLHEGSSACFSAASYKMGTQEEEEKQEGVEETSVVHGDGGLEQSSEVMSADFFLKHARCNTCPSWSPQGSLEDLNTQKLEDEEGNEEERRSVLSEGIGHRNILAYLSGSSSTSKQREWTPESSCSNQDSVLNLEGEYVSLAVEVSCSSDAPRHSDTHGLIASSRIVSPETDSGFGSSYLNQSGSGPFQPNLLTESVDTHNEGLSGSDSEGSCSNLQTAIHSVSLTSQWKASPHPSVQTRRSSAGAAVDCSVESTNKESLERLQGSDSNLPAQIRHHVSASEDSTMDTEKRCSQSYCCPCNSEAILALQSEVSRLKKDLEEGLVQLPHLAQKMDYLTSKYKQDRQECRSRTRPRTHHRSATNRPSSSRQNVSNHISSPDWISSDMDPSKSKGTDSGDTEGSEIMLQFCNLPLRDRRGSGVQTGPEFVCKPHQTLQSRKGSERSVKTYGLTSSGFKGGKEGVSDNDSKQRAQTIMENVYSKERWSPFSSPSLQKPLLQVNYCSSSSLPASYKVREPPLELMSRHSKRSTQSDTALLPSNVYFQRTLSSVSVPSKAGSRTGRRRGSKEEDMNRTLDQAIEVARSMKRTTDRMAKRLSTDLAKAQLYKKLYNKQPLGGRNHLAL